MLGISWILSFAILLRIGVVIDKVLMYENAREYHGVSLAI